MNDTSNEAVEQMIGESDYSCGDSDSAKDDMLRALAAERDALQAKLDEAVAEIERLKKRRRGGGGRKPIPVTIRGVEYASVKKAATALGVSVSTVKSARQNGRLDNVGLGVGYRDENQRKAHGDSVRAVIEFNGCQFDGWKQVIHITGMSRNTLLRKGAVTKRKFASIKGGDA